MADTDSLSSLFGVTTPDATSLGPLMSQNSIGSATSNLFSLPGSSSAPSLFSLPSSLSNSSPNANGSITQTERLFTTRSRWAFVNPRGGGDRGTRAVIQLMTNNPTASANRSGSSAGFGAPAGLTGTGNPLDQAINPQSSKYNGYSEFLLTRIHGGLDEKLQIVETFGDGEVVYYFGRQPIMFEMAGILIDSQDNAWFYDWINMYGHVMRGSQLAQNYELLKIILPNMTLIGTIPHMSYDQDAQNDVEINFEFQFLVKQMIPNPVVAIGAPMSNSASLINFNTASSFLSQQGINSINSQANTALAVIQNPSSTVGQIGSSLTSLGSGLAGGISSLAGFANSASSALNGITGGLNSATNSVVSSINDVFFSVEANLAGIRASLFSPIYGVLTSLTKLISNVAGDVASVFNTLASAVSNIVRDVTNVASQALGILSLVNSAENSILGVVSEVGSDLQVVFGSLIDTAGCITTIPTTITQSLQYLVSTGGIPVNVGFLQNPLVVSLSISSANAPSKIALLNSGAVPNASTGATL